MKCVRSALFILVSVTVTFAASAQTVRFDSARKLWFLSTRDTSYVLGINEQNEMQHVYWGKRIAAENDFAPAHLASAYGFETREGRTAEEYPAWGGMRYGEPCLKVTFPDGNRDLVLKFDSQKIGSDILEITLKDISYGVFVTLRYRVFTAFDVIEKSVRVDNRTKEPIVVESAQSGVWHLPSGQHYRLSYLHGYWAGETRLAQEPIDPGKKILESRRGNTSGQANPWFAIDAGGAADEEHGKVWFGALGWSGNWKLVIEDTPYDQVRVVGGFNDFDFSYPLKPGESLKTPLFYGGYTELGFGDAARLVHRFEREAILPARSADHLRSILNNSWEATQVNVDEAGREALSYKAARAGIQLFVTDDGWFGRRNDDHAGLGDWYVNPQKFPNGLGPLIQYVKSKGMKF